MLDVITRFHWGLIKKHFFSGKTHTMFGADWEYVGNN